MKHRAENLLKNHIPDGSIPLYNITEKIGDRLAYVMASVHHYLDF